MEKYSSLIHDRRIVSKKIKEISIMCIRAYIEEHRSLSNNHSIVSKKMKEISTTCVKEYIAKKNKDYKSRPFTDRRKK